MLEGAGKGDKEEMSKSTRMAITRALTKKEIATFGQSIVDFTEDDMIKVIGRKMADILLCQNEIIVSNRGVIQTENELLQAIEFRHEIEWQPLVRCKNCAWAEEVGPKLYLCHNKGVQIVRDYVDPDWFCGDGKRR